MTEKEPFYKSVRFWVSVLTPVIAALLEVGAQYVPGLKDLSADQLAAIVAALVVMALTYVGARTIRNTAVKS